MSHIIKSRKICITPKNTSANTQYWEIEDPKDESFVYTWLYRIVCDISEHATFDEDVKKEWFRRRPGTYPKGKNGPNSHASIIGGICSAKLMNPNKNLSTPQLDAVEAMFDFIETFYKDEENPPTSIGWEKKIFSVEVPKKEKK